MTDTAPKQKTSKAKGVAISIGIFIAGWASVAAAIGLTRDPEAELNKCLETAAAQYWSDLRELDYINKTVKDKDRRYKLFERYYTRDAAGKIVWNHDTYAPACEAKYGK